MSEKIENNYGLRRGGGKEGAHNVQIATGNLGGLPSVKEKKEAVPTLLKTTSPLKGKGSGACRGGPYRPWKKKRRCNITSKQKRERNVSQFTENCEVHQLHLMPREQLW